MRLFVAIPLPPEIRLGLETLCRGVPGARWLSPETMHLTLRFIGEVDGHAFEDTVEALEQVHARPFELAIAGVGHFESGRQPRVLWAGITRSDPLMRLQAGIETALQRAGLEPEGRKYAPHVTLARLKDAQRGRVQTFLAEHSLYRSLPFTVTGFTLFSSFLSRSGAIHRPEAVFPFEGVGGAEDEAGPAEDMAEGGDEWASYDPWDATRG